MRYPVDVAVAAALLVFVLCCIVTLALNWTLLHVAPAMAARRFSAVHGAL